MRRSKRKNLKKKRKGNTPKHRDHTTNRHHVLPASRGGGTVDNLVVLDVRFHNGWHYLFANMTMAEIYDFIQIVMTPNRTFTANDLHDLRNRLKGE